MERRHRLEPSHRLRRRHCLLAAVLAPVLVGGLALDAFAVASATTQTPAASQVSAASDVSSGAEPAAAVEPVTDPPRPARQSPAPTTVELSSDDWSWPLSPTPAVVAGFKPPATPYGPGHVGVDLLGWPGQTVTSVAAGTVSFAGQVAGRPVVSVVHGTERATYQPVVASVNRGDVVVAGQVLGILSNTGGHCLPLSCLHLGRIADNIYLDPLELLGGGPVRLLPRHGP